MAAKQLPWLVGVTLLVTTCRTADETQPSKRLQPVPPVEAATRRYAGTTLTYYGDSVGLGARFDQMLTDRFASDTGIRVTIIPRPQSASETYAGYQRLFHAQNPDVDVLILDVIWPGAFAPHLIDLKSALGDGAKNAFAATVQADTVDGRLVALPYFMDAGLLYYRTDLLQRYGFTGPPQTWDDLERMAHVIQEGERRQNRRFTGYVWQGNPSEALTCNALEWQSSQGGNGLFDPAGRVTVDNPHAVAAFRRAANWIGTISPPGVTSYQEEDCRNVFESGNAAFMRNWPYATATGAAPASPIRGKFAVAPLPHGQGRRSASALGGWHLAVSRYSRHPEAARQLIRYLTSPAVQTWRAIEGAYLPAVRSVYANPAVRKAQPFFAVMPGVLDHAVARPSSLTKGYYNEVSTAYYLGVAEILQGGDPTGTAAKMRQELMAIAKDGGWTP